MKKQRKLVVAIAVVICFVAAVMTWGGFMFSQGIRALYAVAETATKPLENTRLEKNRVYLGEDNRVYYDECYGNYKSQWLALSAKYGGGQYYEIEASGRKIIYSYSLTNAYANRKAYAKVEAGEITLEEAERADLFSTPRIISTDSY